MKPWLAIFGLLVVASCSSTTSTGGRESSSLDTTISLAVSQINESSSMRIAMGDKLITHATSVARSGRCVLAVRDKKHTELGGASEASDVNATIDLRRVNDVVGIEPFKASGYRGAVLAVSAIKNSAAIRQEVDLTSSSLGLTHRKGEVAEFDFTIADEEVARHIKRSLEHAVTLCRGGSD